MTRMAQLDYAEPYKMDLFTPQSNKSDVGNILVYMEWHELKLENVAFGACCRCNANLLDPVWKPKEQSANTRFILFFCYRNSFSNGFCWILSRVIQTKPGV